MSTKILKGYVGGGITGIVKSMVSKDIRLVSKRGMTKQEKEKQHSELKSPQQPTKT